MNRSALHWAGLLTILTLALTGCGEGPDMIVDGGMCQNTPHLCPDDASTGDGSPCVPFGDEADYCTDNVDNDCDGDTDSGDSDCGGTCPGFAVENTMALCTDGVDNDCNGSQDNEMPGMDPNCEPMSCTPGSEPGPDPLEDLHRPGECHDDSWVDQVAENSTWTFAMIMADDKTWSCCPPGCTMLNCGCFTAGMGYGAPSTEGYEGGASFSSGDYAIESERTLARYTSESISATFTFAPDGATGTYVQTINNVTTTFNCQ